VVGSFEGEDRDGGGDHSKILGWVEGKGKIYKNTTSRTGTDTEEKDCRKSITSLTRNTGQRSPVTITGTTLITTQFN